MRNILVADDGGEPAHRALETGIDLAKRLDASLGVAIVIPVHGGRTPSDPWTDKTVQDRQLAEAREIVARHGITAEMFAPVGDPAKTIENLADKGHYDTIVVGSRGLGTIDRLVLGSVSEHVATHAKATVVVAR